MISLEPKIKLLNVSPHTTPFLYQQMETINSGRFWDDGKE